MSEARFHKNDIAKYQLETAVQLFLHGMDRSSSITLAGASSGILDRLVRNAGKESFVDYARKIHLKLVGFTPKRQSYSHHIDKSIGVIAHKHLSAEDSEIVELDLEQMAVNALARALADYVTLHGQEEPFVRAFYNWAWENNDGRALVEAIKKGERPPEPIMSPKPHKRIALAENQLETAVGLFISGKDRFSSITLAGAADVILCRLVSNHEKENFTEFALRQETPGVSPTKTKETHGKDINDTLFINHLKHMDAGDDGNIDLDVDACAVGAILKALANYVIIVGREKEFVKAFLAWVQLNLDPKKYNIYCAPNWKPSPELPGI